MKFKAMKKYNVIDLSEGVFASPITVEAINPKKAAEIATRNKVERVTNGGSIVVYGFAETRYGEMSRSYVYEFEV